MRRKDREVKDFDVVKEIIKACDVIRIGLADEDLYPYIVPMNFGYEFDGEQIYFYLHGAMAGRKYELMKKNGKCSFEMDCGQEIIPLVERKEVTTRYQCLMGKTDVVFLEGEEKIKGIDCIMESNEESRGRAYNEAAVAVTAVVKLVVTDWSCKVNKV